MRPLKLTLLPGLLAGLAIVAALPTKDGSPREEGQNCGDKAGWCKDTLFCHATGKAPDLTATCLTKERCCVKRDISKGEHNLDPTRYVDRCLAAGNKDQKEYCKNLPGKSKGH